MLNRRRMLLGGTALATATVIASAPLVTSTLSRAADPKVGADVIAWLKANALPLATAEPGSGFHDLEPLRPLLSKARIVSMGEATHGTREFFQLKHRLIEYCVSELGFTIIALEDSYGAMLATNDYVLQGKGAPNDGLGGNYDTEEVVALVEWVRTWNLTHDRKVKLYGLDMQDTVAPTLHLLAYLERVAPELAAALERNLAPLVSRYSGGFSLLSTAAKESIIAQIKAVLDAFGAERDRWVRQSGEYDWHLARQSAVVLEQHARMELLETGRFTFRDRCMADNVRALLDMEGAGAKALLWAHNGHVSRAPFRGSPVMGGFLHADYGAEHVVVGFAFNQGGLRAWGLTDGKAWVGGHIVGPAPDHFLDAVLAATGIPLFALDLTRVPADGPVASWMAGEPLQRTIGAVFLPELELKYAFPGDPRQKFDVLLFVESTTAARGEPYTVPSVPLAPILVSDTNEKPANLALAGGNEVPSGWHQTTTSQHLVAVTDEASPRGGRTVRIARTTPSGEGALTQSFPAALWRGRRLMFSAAMRAETTRIGTGAQLIIYVWPKPEEGTAAWEAEPIVAAVQSDGLVRSPDWVRRSVAVDIPAEAERIQVILAVTRVTAGWFGDLELAATDSSQPVTGVAHAPRKQQTIGAAPANSFLNQSPWSLDLWR